MVWTYFDDQYPEHPKVEGLSDGAFRLHTSAIFYCSRHLTDGFVPTLKAARLTPGFKARYVQELLEKPQDGEPLWVQVEGGYEIHDYLEWNKSKAEIEEKREKIRAERSAAGKKGAQSRWQTA